MGAGEGVRGKVSAREPEGEPWLVIPRGSEPESRSNSCSCQCFLVQLHSNPSIQLLNTGYTRELHEGTCPTVSRLVHVQPRLHLGPTLWLYTHTAHAYTPHTTHHSLTPPHACAHRSESFVLAGSPRAHTGTRPPVN